jgi:hypothetical protein
MRHIIMLAVLVMVAGCGSTSVHEVAYEAGSSAPGIKITWADQRGAQQATSGAFGPEWHAASADVPSGTTVSMTAQNSADSGYVRCAISVDGKEATAKRSDGAYGVVSCTATIP